LRFIAESCKIGTLSVLYRFIGLSVYRFIGLSVDRLSVMGCMGRGGGHDGYLHWGIGVGSRWIHALGYRGGWWGMMDTCIGRGVGT
jgi:hypothetical protein